MIHLRNIRIISQILFFCFFILLFFFVNRLSMAYQWDPSWFLRINPLTAFTTLLASHTVILKIVIGGSILAVLTILFGRFFCGAVCPLGSLIDFSDSFLFDKLRSGTIRPPQFLQKLKYVFLIVIITLAMFGVLFSLFMDPISVITRIFAILFYPFVYLLGTDALKWSQPLLEKTSATHLAFATLKVPLFYGSLGTFLLVLLIFGTSFFGKRFYCQYICPSGAFFALLSRFPLWRRRVLIDKCSSCAACVKSCPTRAIDLQKVDITSTSECIVCGNCTNRKTGCGHFGFGPVLTAQTKGLNIERRHAILGIAAGLALVPVLRSSAFQKYDRRGRLIRPPGTLPEDQFLSRCITCGECLKVCPTNAIQPCMLEEGFHRLYTPRIVPRIGGCEEKCYLCGHVCPSGAIQKLKYDDKQFAKIGTAVIDKHRCIAWEQNKECLVCDEICPYNAISMTLQESALGYVKVPVIDEGLCLGCGLCEQQCPVFDESAIMVYRFGENRQSTGIYASDWQKKEILQRRKKTDNSAFKKDGFKKENSSIKPQPKSPTPLPPGFTFD
jgi:MauM/NapG family ferredoxin protein